MFVGVFKVQKKEQDSEPDPLVRYGSEDPNPDPPLLILDRFG
jgi:hypothetical protein